MKIFWIMVVMFCFSKETTSKPVLFSTSKWLFGRLFASNFSMDRSTQNIEDLSEERPFFHRNKHANRTMTNEIVNAEDPYGTFSQVTDLTKGRANHDVSVTSDVFEEADQNETASGTPGILQKKISKILNKLQLYSAVRSTIHNVRKQQNGVGDENVFDNWTNSNDDKNKQKNILTPNTVNASTSNDSGIKDLPPKRTANVDDLKAIKKINDNNQEEDFDKNIDEPFVFDDKFEGIGTKEQTELNNQKDNRLSLETGNIGIHIMEIFGSIATIFLTAVYHLGIYANSLTGSASGGSQAITSPPIEGTASSIKWKFN